MSIELINFALLVALVCYNLGIQAYIHFEAYPLFQSVNDENFAEYVGDYERRLTIPLLVPYGLTILSSIGVIALGPSDVPLIGAILVLILNLSVAGVSLMVAAPVYERVKANGPVGEDFAQLMKINLGRLVLSAVIVVLALALLLDLLTNS